MNQVLYYSLVLDISLLSDLNNFAWPAN